MALIEQLEQQLTKIECEIITKYITNMHDTGVYISIADMIIGYAFESNIHDKVLVVKLANLANEHELDYLTSTQLGDIHIKLALNDVTMSDNVIKTKYPQLAKDINKGIAGNKLLTFIENSNYLYTDSNTISDVFNDYQQFERNH